MKSKWMADRRRCLRSGAGACGWACTEGRDGRRWRRELVQEGGVRDVRGGEGAARDAEAADDKVGDVGRGRRGPGVVGDARVGVEAVV
jgi:hypothetical protein